VKPQPSYNPIEESKMTPLMQQYFQFKAKYPDALLLYRVGDFYETFGSDAILTANTLGITLTKRNNGGVDVELAGFPYHSLDTYMPKLVKAGFRVAICDQLEKASKEKKIVKRGVTEIITPGIASDDKLLDHQRNNYLAAISYSKDDRAGIAFLDISTGEFLVAEGAWVSIDKLLQSFQPSEIILQKSKSKEFNALYGDIYYTYSLDEWVFTKDFTREKLLQHFGVPSLKGYGIEDFELSQMAAGAVLHYLALTENTNIRHISTISRIHEDRYVWLDKFTIRNLELVTPNNPNGVPLIQILDKTVSPMGSRLLKKWVLLPLKDKIQIEARLKIVKHFLENPELSQHIENYIRQTGDLERLISRVALLKVAPREMVQLKRALFAVEEIKNNLALSKEPALQKIAEGLNPCRMLREQIEREIVPEPASMIQKGNVIAEKVSAQLDEYRMLMHNSREVLTQIQQREADKTGISNLKIGFNNVFGYFLEVTNKHKDNAKIPADWKRKQTTANSERYVTEELKHLEAKILTAEESSLILEDEIFSALIATAAESIQPIQHNAQLIARLDCLLSFAKIAEKNNYTYPQINDTYTLDIQAGRHPVVEKQLPLGETYVPNDIYLDNENQQILMITGPNMAGKSALLRQTALICLMAQMGSYVPAQLAKLGLTDKIFTRVGATDNISTGESTFMVEMNETASILNNISDRSLILLDEIGRGTSTYDGISIAWAIAEYLHSNPLAQPKTLFATHYHELNELSDKLPRIKNFHVATKELDHKVIFLRKLVTGGSEHSFGIHVARMAGMPRVVVERASEILLQLEQKMAKNEATMPSIKQKMKNMTSAMQLNFFEASDPALIQLKSDLLEMDINTLTPVECMMRLIELQKLVRKK
jgi:DNA mismatch repair protein MutS